MAGLVKARIQTSWDGWTWAVTPDHCPAMDEDEMEKRGGDKPICTRLYADGGRRHCIHLIAVSRISNANERADASTLLGGAPGRFEVSARDCGSLCQAQRRNRPAGC